MKFDKLIELLKEMETTIEAEENQTFLEKLNREELNQHDAVSSKMCSAGRVLL